MVVSVTGVRDSTIAALCDDPAQVWRVVAREDPDMFEEARRKATPRPGFFARLFGVKAEAPRAPAPDIELAPDEGEEFDVDKAWHAMHFILTKSAEEIDHPLGFLLSGGKEIGDEEVGYGPARAYTSTEVRKINSALQGFPPGRFVAAYNAGELTAKKIYPEIIWERDGDEARDYVVEHAGRLREVISGIASRGYGMLVWMS